MEGGWAARFVAADLAARFDDDGTLVVVGDLGLVARRAGVQRCSFAPGRLSSTALGVSAARVWSNDVVDWATKPSQNYCPPAYYRWRCGASPRHRRGRRDLRAAPAAWVSRSKRARRQRSTPRAQRRRGPDHRRGNGHSASLDPAPEREEVPSSRAGSSDHADRKGFGCIFQLALMSTTCWSPIVEHHSQSVQSGIADPLLTLVGRGPPCSTASTRTAVSVWLEITPRRRARPVAGRAPRPW